MLTVIFLKALLIICFGIIFAEAFSSLNRKLHCRLLSPPKTPHIQLSMIGVEASMLSEFVMPSMNDLAFPILGISAGFFGIVKIAIYSRMQLISASMIGGIPKNYRVVELDAIDGKNVFYLPKGTEYTAVMSPGADATKAKEKIRINEQLILECIGKVNREGLGIQGKVRTRTQEIPSRSVDCVLSVGGLGRAATAVEVVQEAYRMLRPGGLFVFVEPDGQQAIVKQILTAFPEKIMGGISAGEKARRSQKARSQPLVSVEDKGVGKRKKNSQKSARLKGNNKSADSDASNNINTFAIDTNEEEDNDEKIDAGSEGIDSLDNAIQVQESVAVESIQGGSNDSDRAERPGITFQRYQNLLDPYIVGIAVRP